MYNSKEYEQLAKISGTGAFSDSLGITEHKAKVYSLLPFLFEACLTDKNFVLRMQLYPKAQLLQLDTL